ncbi:MAG TPA: hypothetical protein VKU61_15765 [Candidatus Binatia bacterium]|nr:hypothetical protein [Candidatus Binatia bacterium]
MKRVRYVLLAGLGMFLALPTARIYTATAPWVTSLELDGSNLVGVVGKGIPGQVVTPLLQQATFAPGAPGDTTNPWRFCSCVNGCNPYFLSAYPITVDSYGNWAVKNINYRVFPTYPTSGCPGAVMSAIDLLGGGGPYHVVKNGSGNPGWINLVKANSVATTRGGLYNGWWASAMAAAAPETKEEDGADLTRPPFVAGQYVTWRATNGTFLAPGAPVDSGGFLNEGFPFIAGAIQGHAPGGSLLLAAEIPSKGGGNDLLKGVFNALKNICNGGFFNLW